MSEKVVDWVKVQHPTWQKSEMCIPANLLA